MSLVRSIETSMEAENHEFYVDLTMDRTTNHGIIISPTKKKRKDEKFYGYTGESRWIEFLRDVMPAAVEDGLKMSTLEAERYFVFREGRVSWSETGSNYEPASKVIRLTDFERSLLSLRSRGLLKNEDLIEIRKQRKILEEKRSTLFQYQGKVIVVCGGELFIGDTLDEAMGKAREKYKDKPFYSESIGIIEFPSVYEW